MIVGIDPGFASIGVAYLGEKGDTRDGKVYFSARTIKTDAALPVGERLNDIYKDLDFRYAHHDEYNTTTDIAIERFATRVQSDGILHTAQALGVIEEILWRRAKIVPVYITPTSIKKHLTGNGKATKSEVKEAVMAWLRKNTVHDETLPNRRFDKERWLRHTCLNEHQVDAMAVAIYRKEQLDGKVENPKKTK